jgi:hypothetical protein
MENDYYTIGLIFEGFLKKCDQMITRKTRIKHVAGQDSYVRLCPVIFRVRMLRSENVNPKNIG